MMTMKLKTFLVLLAMMVGAVNGAWAGKTVGATDNSTGYAGAYSDEYSLTPGDQLHLEFTNYSSKGENWHNWLLFLTGATDSPFVLRADNWWFSGSNDKNNVGSIVATLTVNNWPNDFKNYMDGASVNMDITHNGSTISVNVSNQNGGSSYTEELVLTSKNANATITAKLSVERSHLVINTVRQTYDFVSAVNDRFTYGSDWRLYQSGLYNGGGGLRSFSIGNLYNGDLIKISYQKYNDGGSNNYDAATFTTANAKTSDGAVVSNSTVLESGSSYFMSSDGTLGFNFHRYVKITSIEITRTPEDTPALSFSSYSFGSQRVGDSFTEPTLSVTPSTATAHYSSSNISVATVDEYTGDVTFHNAGSVTITATLTVGGVTVTDSYSLTVLSANTAIYTCDFTGSGKDTLLTTYAYTDSLQQIDFTQKQYGNKTFNHTLDFFALHNGFTSNTSTGVSLKDGGIDFKYNEKFYVLNLHNGDKVTIVTYALNSPIQSWSSNYSATTTTTSEHNFTTTGYVTEDGILTLSINQYTQIKNIIIEHDWGSASFIWSDANLTNKFDTSSGGKLLRYDLSTLNFIEPTAIVSPATATYTVRSLNQDVAKIGTDGDVMFINTGWVNIQGTMKTDGHDYRDTYTVEVWANPGNYSESGNTCYMSDIGMLNSDRKTVTSIGGITLEFGSAEDATLIVEDPTGTTNRLVAYTINKLNGWRHKYPNCSLADPVVPTHGSFYKFTAQTNGAFSFKGIKNGGANTVVLVDASAMGTNLTTIAEGSWGFVESATVNLTAGHTYYLYGNVPEDANSELGWSAFLLSEFTFNSTLRLLDSTGQEVSYGAISSNVEGSAEVLTIDGITNPQVDVLACSSQITASFSVSDNKLYVSNISGDGGAIRLKISDGSTAVKYYTLTIPYRNGTHVWDFRTGSNGQSSTGIVSALKKNVDTLDLHLSGLARTYKVISKSGAGVWEHLIEPIIGVNGRVLGDNGFYFDKTAGLIFETRSLGLGAMETKVGYHTVTNNTNNAVTYYSDSSEIPDSVKNNNNYTIAEATSTVSGDNYPFDDETEYRLTYKATKEASWLKMRGTSKIIFPGVKAGQYIKIYTYRHSNDKGETFYAENLVDLETEAHTYDNQHTFKYHGVLNGSNSGGIERCEGAAIFKVPSNYSNANNILSQMPSVTLSDDGWANIYKIEVCDEYSTDMKMSLNRGVYPEFIDVEPDCEYSSIVIKDGTPVVQEYSGVCTQILVENAGTVNFYFEPLNGLTTDDYEVERFMDRTYNLVRVTYKSGHGVLKITQKEERGGYTIDKKDFYIAVNSLNSKTYPYTWDFTSHNMFQGNSSTETNLETPTGASFDGYGKWTNTNRTYGVNFKTNVAMEDATTSKPLFAHGSELCAGSTPIVEMAGLGVAGAYTTSEVTRNNNTYTYKTYTNTSNGISFDGNVLTFTEAGEITIPQVDNGMYVFVKSSVKPTTFTGLTELSENPFDVLEGVWLFQNQSEKQDCILTFSEGATIQTIAVTDITKGLDKFGCATESRDRAIDHTYEGTLTNNDVNAYIITTDDYGTPYNYKGYPMVKKTHIDTDIVPANVGVVLCKDDHSGDPFISPLFVPAVNNVPAYDEANSDFWKSNWMIPNVQSKRHYNEETSRSAAAETTLNALPYYDNGSISSPAWNMKQTSDATIFGSYSSDPVRYVDLSGFKELRIYQTDSNPAVRCFFYNAEGTSSVTVSTTSTPSDAPTLTLVGSGENQYYSVDLKAVYDKYGQVKLIGIKAATSDGSAYVSDVKAISYVNSDPTWCTKFIMSPNYFVYYKNTGGTSTQQNALVESFYRMRLYHGTNEEEAEYNTLAANKALLLIPSENLPTALWNGGNGLARQGVIYMDLQDIEDADATGVDAPIANAISDEQAVYYTLSGNRTNGKPTKKGIYISNGKKVCIK